MADAEEAAEEGLGGENDVVRFAADTARHSKIYGAARNKKVIRVLTVVGYVISVSLAGVMLSLYYTFIWEPGSTATALPHPLVQPEHDDYGTSVLDYWGDITEGENQSFPYVEMVAPQTDQHETARGSKGTTHSLPSREP
ncbi:unnamed protein product [Darwinula stevensoni]|uniref:Transmembrane protein INAFM2 n=1 Tax=Darwinula stevensoni TaxID=69355 RepID=A0A7R8WZY5_9CRUS|nr:unnamed protein product [Darwinula stevensoni]CAG0880647.1 unnamed protein product [Darwinula stevensoni]